MHIFAFLHEFPSYYGFTGINSPGTQSDTFFSNKMFFKSFPIMGKYEKKTKKEQYVS